MAEAAQPQPDHENHRQAQRLCQPGAVEAVAQRHAEATDALDPEGERKLMQLLLDEFPTATIMTVGFHADLEPYHQRKLTLTPTPEGMILVRETRKAWEEQKRSVNWGGRLFGTLLRRNERRSLSAGQGKHGDWRN